MLVLLFVCLYAGSSLGDRRAELGYPAGLLSECPGSTKPAEIPKTQLKHLVFMVQGRGRTRHTYNYWQAKAMAKDPRINFKRKTVVIALGYLDSIHFPISAMLGNEYEIKGYNVILVDNQRFATVHYFLSSRLMRPVGKHVAEVLAQLVQLGLNPSKVELLGFSLGVHTVGYVASHFQQITGRNISRITALEPSGPCFRNLGPKERLNPSVADFVQVIHTNIDGFGMAARMGHVDFYVNGGEFQPSEVDLYPCGGICSHFRVLTIWISALKHPGKFVAMKCNSIQQARDSLCYYNEPMVTNFLGFEVDTRKHGIFYLGTSKGFPYYMDNKGLLPEYESWKRITNVNDGNETEVYT